MTADEFARLSAMAQQDVLFWLYNDAANHIQSDSILIGARYLEQLIGLGTPVFGKLTSLGQEMMLRALYNTGVALGQSGDAAGKSLNFQRVISMGSPVFAKLPGGGREMVLRALTNTAVSLGEGGDAAGALLHCQHVIDLGAPVFAKLPGGGREAIVSSLFYTGLTLGQGGDTAGELLHCQRAITLGEPVFADLTPQSREAIVASLHNIGVSLGEGGDTAGALLHRQRAINLGAPFFFEFTPNGRQLILSALLTRNSLAIQSRLNCHQSLVQASVVNALVSGAAMAASSHEIALAIHSQQTNLNQHLCWRAALSAARWWLTDFQAFPAKGSHPLQRQQVIALASALAHQHWQAKNLRHRVVLDTVVPSTQGQSWEVIGTATISTISKWATAQVMDSLQGALPAEDPNLPFLARVRASVDITTDWPEQAPWRVDQQSLYQALRVDELFFEDGSMRAPYWWLDGAGHPRLKSERFAQTANDAKGDLFKALQAWRGGDSSLAVNMLEQGLQQLQSPTYRRDGEQRSALEECTHWLQDLGAPAQQARMAACDALIYGDIEKTLQTAFEAWITKQLRQAPDSTQALNATFGQLLRWLPVPTNEFEILERLHQFLGAQIEADSGNPAALWSDLEMQRFTLASAVALSSEGRAPDKPALDSVRVALETSLIEIGERIKRIQAGETDNTPSPEFEDIPVALFETLAGELKRLGHALVLPTPQSCEAVLKPGEHLVQLWFAPSDGSAHALTLSANDTAPRHVVLPATLALDQWKPLLEVSEQGRVYARTAWWSTGNVPTNDETRRGSAAWSDFVAQDSVASVLLRSLQQDLGLDLSAPQACCILLLPANLARLPWLARAVSGTVDGVGDFRAGAFVLEASVSAWLATRKAYSTDARQPMPAGQVVYLPGDRCGLAEAQLAAGALGTQSQEARGLIELTRALQSPGPAHLVVHGQFTPFDPLASFLSLNDSPCNDSCDAQRPDLPAWLIASMQAHGDISLSACQGMLVGHGVQQSQWGGPAGIGPLLRARGARSVAGSLGLQNKLASLLFYALFFEARCELSATQALARAQQLLRSMTKEQVMVRIQQISPSLYGVANAHRINAEDCGWKTPFADPEMWAQFTLLGTCEQLLAPPAKAAPLAPVSTDNSSWLGRLWRRLWA